MERVKKGVSYLLILAMCLPLVLQCAGTVSAAEGGQEYCVQLEEVKNGRLKLGDSDERSLNYKSKDKVTVRIYPKEGFQLEKLEILDAETGEEEMVMAWNNEEELSFQMPAKDVLVKAYFEKAGQDQEAGLDQEAGQDQETGLDQEAGQDPGAIASKETKEADQEHTDPQTEGFRTFAAERSSGTSGCLRRGIGMIRVCDDNNVAIKEHSEGMLSVNGTMAYCANPLVGFKSGNVTGINPLDYGMTQYDLTVCALIDKYAQECTSLTENQRYLVAQCMIWRQLNNTFKWNCGNIHIDNEYLDLTTQGQVMDAIQKKAGDNYYNYIGEGTVYINGSTQPLAQFSVRPASGQVQLQKSSGNTEITKDNSCYTLEGAQYGVYKDRECSRPVATLTTDANGNSNKVSLGAGTYYVKETRAPQGYVLDEQVYTVQVAAAQTAVLRVSDEPVYDRTLIEVYKIDRGTKKPGAEGAASLENARFQVNYYAGYYDKDHLPTNPTRSWVLQAKTMTAENAAGKARTLKEYEKISGDPFYKAGDAVTLPLGTVSIEEIEPPTGYLLDPVYMQLIDGVVSDLEKAEGIYVSQIVQNGNGASLDGGNVYAVADSVVRGDFALTKIDKNTQNVLEGVQFRITSNTTGESHVFTTDANGQYSSSSDYAAHSYHTNGGNSGDGMWFGLNEDGATAAVDDSVGALPYDSYTIEELKCEANEGKFLYKGTISITKDRYLVNLGNIENADVAVGTTAKDEETGTHYAKADSEVTIIDTVEYIGLKKGKEYRLDAALMNRNTGGPVVDAAGEPVTASKNFKPKDSNGTVEMELFFDATGLSGMDVVVFEELYLGEEKLAEHKDLNESSQTIHFPGIGTQAVDSETNCELSKADEEITVVDTVAYENLRVGRKYTLTGVLMDKETKKAVLDKNGDKITAKTEFTAETANGTIDVVFTFDGSHLGGKTLVAFETLTKDKREYAVHHDIEDEAQTIYIPKIGTKAHDEETETHLSRADTDVTIVDEVQYENLIPEREYTLKGTLMDLKTEKAAVDPEGNEITAEVSFTPSEKNGSVELAFQFDGSGFEGKTLVVYEELFCHDKSIAEHKDAEDTEQTIYFPKIRTTASDQETKEKSVYATQKVKIEDVVRYENLIEGKKYKVQGILKDKASGESMLDADGEEIVAETEFTAKETSGEVKVVFEFDGSALAGKTTVVFEELFAEDKSIAVHADIEDEEQTVEFVSPPVPSSPTKAAKTGDLPLKLICIYVILFVLSGGMLVRLELKEK